LEALGCCCAAALFGGRSKRRRREQEWLQFAGAHTRSVVMSVSAARLQLPMSLAWMAFVAALVTRRRSNHARP
jgi:hypothetical protein